MVRQSLPQLPGLRQFLSALQRAKTPVQFPILNSINLQKTRNGMNSGRGMRNKEIPGPVLLTRYSVLVFSDI